MGVFLLAAGVVLPAAAQAQSRTAPSAEVRQYIRYEAPRIVLEHVRVIDGTGAPAAEDRNVVLEGGRIASVKPGADEKPAKGTLILNLKGSTVFPGIIGMHDPLYAIAHPRLAPGLKFHPPVLLPQMSYSAPRLYLAAGVTTLRTAGSVEPQTDLNLKLLIDTNQLPGPHIAATGPPLEGPNGPYVQLRVLAGPEDARRTVDYWADRGIDSIAVAMNITHDELRAAIRESHKRGLKVSGNLCSIPYRDAAFLGIDSIEHGFLFDTDLNPDKQPDTCPADQGKATFQKLNPSSEETKDIFRALIEHHVAVTSTLASFEYAARGRPPLEERVLTAMAPSAREDYLFARYQQAMEGDAASVLLHEMQLERAFASAGGTLLMGADVAGDGGVLPGFGDQRGIELLVEAGFTPSEAIRIATYNAAAYLGEQDHIGSIAAGKNADLVVVKGNPEEQIKDIENVETVFKDGVGYDSARLLESVRGTYGLY